MLGVLLAGACTSMYMHIPRGTSLTCRISDPHHPTQGEGVSPQVECTHVVRLCRSRRALGIIVEKFFACAYGPPGQTDSLREGSHCRLAATGAATRAQLHAYPGGGSLRGLPPSVNPSGDNIHTHTQNPKMRQRGTPSSTMVYWKLSRVEKT